MTPTVTLTRPTGMNKLSKKRTSETWRISQTNQESLLKESLLLQRSLLRESLPTLKSSLRTLRCLSNNWSSLNQLGSLKTTKQFLNSSDNREDMKTENQSPDKSSILRKRVSEMSKSQEALSPEIPMFSLLFRPSMRELEFNRPLWWEEIWRLSSDQLKVRITTPADQSLFQQPRSTNKTLYSLSSPERKFSYNTTISKTNTKMSDRKLYQQNSVKKTPSKTSMFQDPKFTDRKSTNLSLPTRNWMFKSEILLLSTEPNKPEFPDNTDTANRESTTKLSTLFLLTKMFRFLSLLDMMSLFIRMFLSMLKCQKTNLKKSSTTTKWTMEVTSGLQEVPLPITLQVLLQIKDTIGMEMVIITTEDTPTNMLWKIMEEKNNTRKNTTKKEKTLPDCSTDLNLIIKNFNFFIKDFLN